MIPFAALLLPAATADSAVCACTVGGVLPAGHPLPAGNLSTAPPSPTVAVDAPVELGLARPELPGHCRRTDALPHVGRRPGGRTDRPPSGPHNLAGDAA